MMTSDVVHEVSEEYLRSTLSIRQHLKELDKTTNPLVQS
jgi:hypothetical protein